MQQSPSYFATLADGLAVIACAFISGAVAACAIIAAFGGFKS
jgi:hypothetical protein